MAFYLGKQKIKVEAKSGVAGFRLTPLQAAVTLSSVWSQEISGCWIKSGLLATRSKFYKWKMGLILDLAAKLNHLRSRLSAPVLLLRLITWEHCIALLSGDWKKPEIIRVAINNRLELSVVNCLYRQLQQLFEPSTEAAGVTILFISSTWPFGSTAGAWVWIMAKTNSSFLSV